MWHSAKDMAEKSFEDFSDSQHLADYDNYNLMQSEGGLIGEQNFLELIGDDCLLTEKIPVESHHFPDADVEHIESYRDA
ncbi:hypothetical protein Avbf_16430 [Armadillidium vulgare]|nr:hypothetical protein Avbf_16430 [Armadillidium vulgare]